MMLETPAVVVLEYFAFVALNFFLIQGFNSFVHRFFKEFPLLFSTCSFISLVTLGMFWGLFAPGALFGVSSVSLMLTLWGVIQGLKKQAARGWTLNGMRPEVRDLFFVFLLGSSFWLWELRDLAGLPSQDDGVNHLTFFHAILQSGEFFSGKLPYVYSETFGNQTFFFYPTGSHFLTAVLHTPMRLIFHISEFSQLKTTLIFFLSLMPCLFSIALKDTFPQLSRRTLLAVSILSFSLGIFPFYPVSEGGYTRVIGQILTFPFLFRFFKNPLAKGAGVMAWIGVIPALFLIHPSTFLYLGVLGGYWFYSWWEFWRKGLDKKVLFQSFFEILVSAGICAVLIGLSLKTGRQTVTEADQMGNFQTDLAFSLSQWFDRVKGPFHYFFTDPFSLGKFFAPRSILLYLAFVLLGQKKFFESRPDLKVMRVLIPFAFLVPFLYSMLTFVPLKAAKLLGMFFYHDMRRLSEMGLFASVLAWTLALEFLMTRTSSRLKKQAWVVVSLGVTIFGLTRGHKVMVDWNRTFHSPTLDEIQLLERALIEKSPSEGSWILCPSQKAALVHSLPKLAERFHWLTFAMECQPSLMDYEHCRLRLLKAKEIQSRPTRALGWSDCVFEDSKT